MVKLAVRLLHQVYHLSRWLFGALKGGSMFRISGGSPPPPNPVRRWRWCQAWKHIKHHTIPTKAWAVCISISFITAKNTYFLVLSDFLDGPFIFSFKKDPHTHFQLHRDTRTLDLLFSLSTSSWILLWILYTEPFYLLTLDATLLNRRIVSPKLGISLWSRNFFVIKASSFLLFFLAALLLSDSICIHHYFVLQMASTGSDSNNSWQLSSISTWDNLSSLLTKCFWNLLPLFFQQHCSNREKEQKDYSPLLLLPTLSVFNHVSPR